MSCPTGVEQTLHPPVRRSSTGPRQLDKAHRSSGTSKETAVSKKQRDAIDVALRQPQQAPAVDLIEERREGFAAFMATEVHPGQRRRQAVRDPVLRGQPRGDLLLR